MFDWVLDKLVVPFLGLLLIAMFFFLLVVLPYVIYKDAHDPHIALNKTEWHCSHSHTIFVPIMSGKTTIIIPEQICDTYRMNGYD